MRISDWSSDVCSSDLQVFQLEAVRRDDIGLRDQVVADEGRQRALDIQPGIVVAHHRVAEKNRIGIGCLDGLGGAGRGFRRARIAEPAEQHGVDLFPFRSEEHTSELQSLMRISYAVFCWQKKKN